MTYRAPDGRPSGSDSMSQLAQLLLGLVLLGGIGLFVVGLILFRNRTAGPEPTRVPSAVPATLTASPTQPGVPTGMPATPTGLPLATSTTAGGPPAATATLPAFPSATLPPLPTNTPVPPSPTASPPLPTATQVPTAAPTGIAATATSQPNTWRGEYFANRDLAGLPTLLRDDADVNFNWGGGAPTAVLPADNFSVRWQRTLAFGAGNYRFNALSDDGVRVWLDGQLIIDQWHSATNTVYSVERSLTAGNHSLRVDYYEALGTAQIRVWWEPVTAYPQWRGEYFPNAGLSGSPYLIRNDEAINFIWGNEAPAAGLPADNFSARWTRQIDFGTPGVYRFFARADDGVRVFVGGNLIINEWHSSDGTQTYQADVALSGPRQVVVEYYEATLSARVTVTYQQLEPTATATRTVAPPASATPTRTPSATPTPTSTTVPAASATPTNTPLPPTASPTPSPMVTPSPTVTVTPTPSPTTAPTATPTVTPSPTPSVTPPPVLPTVRISEILSVPESIDWNDDGEMDDGDEWIELYNGGRGSVDLSGWALRDPESSGRPYQFPRGTHLRPGGYLVVFRSETAVNLADAGGELHLLNPQGHMVDRVIYPELKADASYSRDEMGQWHLDWPPSPGSANLPDCEALQLHPGQCKNYVRLLFDSLGQLP